MYPPKDGYERRFMFQKVKNPSKFFSSKLGIRMKLKYSSIYKDEMQLDYLKEQTKNLDYLILNGEFKAYKFNF